MTDLQPVHSFQKYYVREHSHDSPFSERVLEAVVPTFDIGVDESLRAGHSSQAHHVDEKHFHSA